MAQWTMRLTMNQKIAGSSPARIKRVLCGKDLDRLVWQAEERQKTKVETSSLRTLEIMPRNPNESVRLRIPSEREFKNVHLR